MSTGILFQNTQIRLCACSWVVQDEICPSTCVQRYEYRQQHTATECPWVDGDIRFVKCTGGECPEPQAIGEETHDGTNISVLFDDLPNTAVTLAYGKSQVALKYRVPLDLEEIHIYGESYKACLKIEFLVTEDRTLGPLDLGCNGNQKSDSAPTWSMSGLSLHGVKHILIEAVQQETVEDSDDGTFASTLSPREEDWNAKLGEVKMRAFPVLSCGSGGFFGGSADCEVLSKPASNLEALDCKGDWSEWSVCDTSCTRIRTLKIISPAMAGGRPCRRYEEEPCTGMLGGSTVEQVCAFAPSNVVSHDNRSSYVTDTGCE